MRTAIARWLLIFIFLTTASGQVTFSPATKEVGAGEMTYDLLVDTGVEWTASVDVPWTRITPNSGRGQTMVQIKVERNTTGVLREATLTIGGTTHRLLQKSASASGHDLIANGSNDYGQLGTLTSPNTRPNSIHRDVVSVAAGSGFTMFVKMNGTLWGVGLNSNGQLGDGTQSTRTTPVQVATGVVSVASGSSHTMFVKTDGTLWAMGNNSDGRLGDGTKITRTIPVQIFTGVASVSAGYFHTMFVKTDGTLWAVGTNSSAQLGDGTGTARTVPVQIATSVASVAAGGWHTMFVKADGSLWAMGLSYYGQLGDGTTITRTLPVQIATGVASVAAGAEHTMFVKSDGTLWAMGNNGDGRLGDGTMVTRTTPVQIATGASSVTAGSVHTMFTKTDGTLWAMGGNLTGQLGDGSTTARAVPVQIVASVAAAAAGYDHTMFVKTDGTLWGTGRNTYGQLGYEPTFARTSPTQIATGVTSIATGQYHTMFVSKDETLWAIGKNTDGQLGDGSTTARTMPVQIATGVTSVAAGSNHTMFIKTNGTLWGMGINSWFELGDGSTTSRTLPVQIASDVASVTAGGAHTMFVKTDGTLWAMGANANGQLGDTTTVARGVPVKVATGVASVAAGSNYTLFVKTDGTLWAIGNNNYGQLGDGTTNSSTTLRSYPLQITTDVASVAAGQYHTMFIKTDGTLWGMGENSNGQLGDGTLDRRTVPVQIASSVTSVAVGQNHTMFVKMDGTLWAMGENANGQLGDGTVIRRTIPVQVANGVTKVSVGYAHTVLLLGPDGRIGGPLPTAPTITIQPIARMVVLGQTATFVVVATGSEPLSYQWQKSGEPISGATTATLTLSNVSANDVSLYSVRVTNAQGSVESNAVALTLGTLPVINTQPLSVSVTAGQTATFAVSATGSGTLTYELVRNGTIVGTSTTGIFSLVNAQSENAGTYTVRVTNQVGSITSSGAALTIVESPPVVTAPPTTRAGVIGQSTTFSAGYFGSGPVTYQWFRDGVAIVGATGATYTITITQSTDAGVYTVQITNALGTTTSAAATLTFANPPSNDNFSNAEAMAGASAAANGTTVGASGETGEPSHYSAGSQASSIWYRWTAPATGTAIFDTAGSTIDTVLALYTGAAVSALNLVGSDDDGLGIYAGGSRLVLSVTSGTTYSIAVAGYSSAARGAIVVRVAMSGAPVITSDALPDGTFGATYAGYTIVGTDAPTLYGATGLPPGIFLNPATGTLTGTPTQAGFYNVTVSAANAVGSGTRRFVLNIAKANATVSLSNLIVPYDGAPKPATAATSPAGLTVSLRYDGQAVAPSAIGGYAVTATIDDSNYQGSATAQLLIMANVTVPGHTYTTFAGTTGLAGSADGTGIAARFNSPNGLAVDASGTLYLADRSNHVVRKITPTGVVAPLAGLAGQSGSVDDTGASARFNQPTGVAVDATGNVFVADSGNHTIRRITPAGVVTTLAGSPGMAGYQDGIGGAARFFSPSGLVVTPSGDVFLTDGSNSTIRRIAPTGVVSTYAGSFGTPGATDGERSVARFRHPNGIAIDRVGYLYITDTGNHLVRRITPGGVVSTLAGSADHSGSNDGTGFGAAFFQPLGLAIDPAGIVLVADSGNRTIRAITPAGVVTTVAGLAGQSGSTDGLGSSTRFVGPSGLALSMDGKLYVADAGNHTIRLAHFTGPVVPPVIAGAPMASGGFGQPIENYLIRATGFPTSYSASGLPNGLVCDPSSGVISGTPNVVGTFPVTITATNSSGSGSATLTLVIGKAPALITVENQRVGFTGVAQTVTATTLPTNLAVVITYNGNTAAPAAAGTYAIVATINDANYQGSTQGTLVIGPASPIITLSGLSAVYDGTPHRVTATTTPSGLPVKIAYDGSDTPPVMPGSYAVRANVDDPSYQGSATATLVISKIPGVVVLNNLTVTYNGLPRPASVTTTPAGLAVSVAYDGTTTAPTDAGSYTVTATINDSRYGGTVSGTLVINKAPATVTLGDLTTVYTGSGRTPSATTSPIGLVVRYTFNGSSTPPTNAGTYAVIGTIDERNYLGSATGTFVISKAVPLLTWPNPAAITYGTALSSTQLNASAGGVAGTFTYNPATGTLLNAGLGQTLAVTFTPTDLGNYVVAATQRLLTVNPAPLTVTADPKNRLYGAANPTFTAIYSGFLLGQNTSVLTNPATANCSAVATSNAGTYVIIPSGAAAPNYAFTYVNGTLTVDKAPLTITADNKSRTYGAANPAFTVSYAGFVNSESLAALTTAPTATTAATVQSNTGTYSITASGGSATNYSFTYVAGTLSITQASLVVTADDKVRAYGAANPSFTVSYVGFMNGETSTVLTTQATATSTANVLSNVGTYPITASGGSAMNYQLSYVPGVLKITTAAAAEHSNSGLGYSAGRTLRIRNKITYTGTLTVLKWQTLLPTGLGWSYVAGTGAEGQVKPKAGATELLEWEWTNIPTSPVDFIYTIRVPVGTTAAQLLTAVASLQQSGIDSQVLAQPEPLSIAPALPHHDADSNQDFRISLFELTRVIELYNTRVGTSRTGAYAVATGDSEDGFVADMTRTSGVGANLTFFHSCDTNQDGRIALLELTRVIELYNTRLGTTRTGAYHVLPGTEDGFSPGP